MPSTTSSLGKSKIEKLAKPNAQNPIRCAFCHKKIGSAYMKLSCNHNIHNSCLRLVAVSGLSHSKYEIKCPEKECGKLINRNMIGSVVTPSALTCYDTLQLISDLTYVEDEKILYYCQGCLIFYLKYSQQSRKCQVCEKRMEKLGNLFTQVKLLLTDKNPQTHSKKAYYTFKECVKQCSIQLKRCDTCGLWKHQLNTLAMKCIC